MTSVVNEKAKIVNDVDATNIDDQVDEKKKVAKAVSALHGENILKFTAIYGSGMPVPALCYLNFV